MFHLFISKLNICSVLPIYLIDCGRSLFSSAFKDTRISFLNCSFFFFLIMVTVYLMNCFHIWFVVKSLGR